MSGKKGMYGDENNVASGFHGFGYSRKCFFSGNPMDKVSVETFAMLLIIFLSPVIM